VAGNFEAQQKGSGHLWMTEFDPKTWGKSHRFDGKMMENVGKLWDNIGTYRTTSDSHGKLWENMCTYVETARKILGK